MTSEYRLALEQTAKDLLRMPAIATQDFLEQLIESEKEKVDRLIELRGQFTLKQSSERDKGWLDLAHFQVYDEGKRWICFVIDRELSDLVDFLRLEQRCAPYRIQQELFIGCPSLMPFVAEEQLIDLRHLRLVGAGRFAVVKGGYGKLDEYLDPVLVQYFERKYGKKKVFVRLDASYFSTQAEKGATGPSIRMIGPKLVKKIRLNRANQDCGPYILQEAGSDSPSPKFWEYHVKNVRRLEVKVKQDGNGKLSMILEELSEKNDNLVVGRCLRAETYPKPGMALSDAVLDNLDLSVNIYHDHLSKMRRVKSLSLEHPHAVSARMQLLHIDGLPFRETLNACRHFFDGKTLVSAWVHDQFVGLE